VSELNILTLVFVKVGSSKLDVNLTH